MALDFYDSFDQYGTIATADALPVIMQNYGWNSSSFIDNLGIGPTYGRFTGSSGMFLSPIDNTHIITPAYGNNSTEFCSFSVLFNNLSPGNSSAPIAGTLIQFTETSVSQIEISINSMAQIRISRNGTILATSTLTLRTGLWYRFEIQCHINSSSGFVEVLVDGVSYVSFTGNTQNTVNAYTTQVVLWVFTNNSSGFNITDFIVYNNSGAAPTGYLGDKKLLYLPPNAAGDVTNFTPTFITWTASTAFVLGNQLEDSNGNVQRCTTAGTTGSGSHPTWNTVVGGTTTDGSVVWTCITTGGSAPNWAAVSETGPDGDDSYNIDGTIGDIDRFVSATIPSTITGIVAVCGLIYSRKDDAGTRSLRISLNSGGTVVDNGLDYGQSTQYAYFGQSTAVGIAAFPTDPHTSSAWTVSGVNALDFGYKVTA